MLSKRDRWFLFALVQLLGFAIFGMVDDYTEQLSALKENMKMVDREEVECSNNQQ